MAKEGTIRHNKAQEGSRKLNKAQEGSIRLKTVQECQRRKGSKSFKLYNCFLIDNRYGWVVNQEGYAMVDLSTD